MFEVNVMMSINVTKDGNPFVDHNVVHDFAHMDEEQMNKMQVLASVMSDELNKKLLAFAANKVVKVGEEKVGKV